MGVFADAVEIDQHVGSMFRRAAADPVVGPRLRRAGVTLRLTCHDPECEVIVRWHDPISVSAHGAPAVPLVTLGLHADILEHFWRGSYSIVEGLAHGEIEARGPVSRVLRVLPELVCLFPHYRTGARTAARPPVSPRAAPESLTTTSTERTTG